MFSFPILFALAITFTQGAPVAPYPIRWDSYIEGESKIIIVWTPVTAANNNGTAATAYQI